MKKSQAQFTKWFGPVLDALRSLGGSGTPIEVSAWIAEEYNLSESQLSETIKSGALKFHNQVCWARQYLVWEEFIDSGIRGVWKLTPSGIKKHITEEEAHDIFLKWVERNSAKRKEKSKKTTNNNIAENIIDEEEIDDDSSIAIDYKEQVLKYLRTMPPKSFERFCLYLLRVNKFENLKLLGNSHDEGIDGSAVLRINPFVSFRVLFQAKRYKNGNNVCRSLIGDFRNAMIGRADKGIFITTSKFTQDAIKEANREGAPQVELVDSDQLIKMIENANIGLKPVMTYEVDHSFFEQYME